jgi:hypothetical protein
MSQLAWNLERLLLHLPHPLLGGATGASASQSIETVVLKVVCLDRPTDRFRYEATPIRNHNGRPTLPDPR